MMKPQVFVARLRTLKLSLLAGGALRRKIALLVEVLEALLNDGLAVVLARVKMRTSRRVISVPRGYSPPPAVTASLPALAIPPRSRPGGATIVIPVLDNPALTRNCLNAIVAHTPTGTYEIVVVDNGSGEETQEMLARVNGLCAIRNETNLGFVEACNQGARAAQGEFLIFLNNDTVVLPDWLEALSVVLERYPQTGAVGAKLLYPDGYLQEAGSIIWNDGSGWNYGRRKDPEAPEFNYVREVDYCSGACLMVRRTLFERSGGFDSRYAPAYYEDVDLCFRFREQGYRVLYQPAARVVHIEGATAGTDLSSGFKNQQKVNRLKFIARHAAALWAQCPPDPRLLRSARDRRSGKRILVVDHMVPQPDQDAGSVRMAAILQILADLGHRVTFLPDDLARCEPYTTELQQYGIEVLYAPMSALAYVKRHVDEYDVVILSRPHFAIKYLATVLRATRRPFLIFDSVDLHHLREQRQAKDNSTLLRAAERTRSVELSLVDASDMVWVTSTHEAEVLRTHGSTSRVEIVPVIHEVRVPVPPFVARRDLVFVGSFRHQPNEDAVHYFVQEIFPLVKLTLPDVQFIVVGSHVTPSILALARADIRVLGHVKNLESLMDACRISVAPLRFGAGVKGKISQSLACGLPVITTPVGAEGMEVQHGKHVMIGADAAEFAQCVIRVYQDETLWMQLSTNGRRHVEMHFGYDFIRQKMNSLMTQAFRESAR